MVKDVQVANGGMGPLGAPLKVPLGLKNDQNGRKIEKLLTFLPCSTLTYQSFPFNVERDVQVDIGGLGPQGDP